MTTATPISASLRGQGFHLAPAAELRAILGEDTLTDWAGFADSWHDLGLDGFMADGGRYRRRRFGCFQVDGTSVMRLPHQPHYQGRAYNALNGGVDRWFDPVTNPVADHPITRRMLAVCAEAIAIPSGQTDPVWHVEMHQFRIEPEARWVGLPTPEGSHRDGVDWVFVTLIARHNVAGGVTAITDETGRSLGSFELSQPLDAVFLDDHRVWHGVTPIRVEDPEQPAYRDALVLTFSRLELLRKG